MSSEKLTHVKWIGPNDPMIRIIRNDARLYLTKRELVSLMNEINGFTAYYHKDFTEERIDIDTPLEEHIISWVKKNDK
jgi:hypothetical protein